MIIVCNYEKSTSLEVNIDKMVENFVKVLKTEEELKNMRYIRIGCSGIPVKV